MSVGDTEVPEGLEQPVEGFAKSEKIWLSGDFERRAKPRVQEPFPAQIWGVDSEDMPINFQCVIDNISSTGVYLKTPCQMPTGAEVSLIVHLLSSRTSGASARIFGEILRDDPQPDGKHGIAVAIKGHRFL